MANIDINLSSSKISFTYQCTYTDKKNFGNMLELLASYGFYGVEVNLPDATAVTPEAMRALLGQYGLKLTRIATGFYAKQQGLYITSPDMSVRMAATEACLKFIEYAKHFSDCGIILGFMKGPAGIERGIAKERAIESLNQIMPAANRAGVRVVLEATNHYETSLAVSVADAAEIANAVGQNLNILPDVYHMNIEEIDATASLIRYRDYYEAVHFSDNNRYLPGLGNIDFKSLYSALAAMGYRGTIGLEGNLRRSLEEDMKVCASLMYSVSRSVDTEIFEKAGE